MTELSIRRATEADLGDVMRLVRACIDDMGRRGIDQWDEVYPAQDRFASDVSAGTLYVGLSGREPAIGAFTLDEHQSPEYAQVRWAILGVRAAVVHRLMVDPRYQGRGLARELMVFAEQRAAQSGFGVVRLDAFSLNPQALQLYRNLGYRDAGSVVFRKGVFRCFEKPLDASLTGRSGS